MQFSDHTLLAKSLGNRIKDIRISRNMTQLDVAIKAGIEEAAYQRVERGRTNPTLKTLMQIANALGVEMVKLFRFSNDESSQDNY